jgi:hypothetical protein
MAVQIRLSDGRTLTVKTDAATSAYVIELRRHDRLFEVSSVEEGNIYINVAHVVSVREADD